MIEAKLKGEGFNLEADVAPPRETNVVDLMAVLKQSLGQTPSQDVAKQPEKKLTKPLKPKRAAASQAATGKSRKRA
jgi:non-homologous end joining protein Ku